VLLLGDAAERSPEEGEVVYRDRRSAICRRFNWREAERTKLTAGTRRAVLVVEALPPATGEDLHGALAELAAGIERWCGGRCRPMVLDAGRPRASLHDEA
jgi:lysyl-tRNA synthetase class 2